MLIYMKQFHEKFSILFNTGVLKLCTSTFLCTLRLLKLYFGNQIWKFMCRYFSKFYSDFLKFDLSFVLWTFNYNKIVLQLKSLRTAVLTVNRDAILAVISKTNKYTILFH